MLQVPAATIVTVLPEIVHTPVVSDVYDTVRPVSVVRSIGSTDFAVGLRANMPDGL